MSLELITVESNFMEQYGNYVKRFNILLSKLDEVPDSIYSTSQEDIRLCRREYLRNTVGYFIEIKSLENEYQKLLRIHASLGKTTWMTIVVNRVRILHQHIQKCTTAQRHAIQDGPDIKTLWYKAYVDSRTYIKNNLREDGKC